jgi:hypothetical protein
MKKIENDDFFGKTNIFGKTSTVDLRSIQKNSKD